WPRRSTRRAGRGGRTRCDRHLLALTRPWERSKGSRGVSLAVPQAESLQLQVESRARQPENPRDLALILVRLLQRALDDERLEAVDPVFELPLGEPQLRERRIVSVWRTAGSRRPIRESTECASRAARARQADDIGREVG